MSAEPALVDTNVLVYSRFQDAEHHAVCRALPDGASQSDAALCLTSQVLAEFYAVVTNPKRVSQPRRPAEVLEFLDLIVQMPGITMPAHGVRRIYTYDVSDFDRFSEIEAVAP